MPTQIPRLTLVSVASESVGAAQEAAARLAVRIARAAARAGLDAAPIVAGADRDGLPEDLADALSRAAGGRSVQRIDPALAAAPALQRAMARAASGAQLALVVPTESIGPGAGAAALGRHLDAAAALLSPLVLVVDAEAERRSPLAAACAAAARSAARALGPDRPAPVVALSEGLGTDHAPRIAEVTGLEVIAVGGAQGPLSDRALDRLLRVARAAPPVPPAPPRARGGARARVAILLDECFDLYDEESLVQLEVAGADLVPVRAFDDRPLPDVDGLVLGDGRVERHSADLARARRFRASVAAAVEAGVPTLAFGGGLAYLARGLRTRGGALHPFAGVLDAQAIALAEPPARGHAEVETLRPTPIGPVGTRVAGYVQRDWLLRGVPREDRRAYRTLRGVRDDGVARGALVGLHLRAYLPSCPMSGVNLVDACVRFAVRRDRERPGSADRTR